MRFLVFSDIHHASPAPLAPLAEEVDGIIFLGDGWRAAEGIKRPDKPFYAVCGNCDVSCPFPEETEITAEGKRLLICHGHRYGVKHTAGIIAQEARARGCAAALFGHTHEPAYRYEDGVYLLNPGTAGGPSASCGFLDVRRDGLIFSVLSLKDRRIVL